MSLKGAYAKAKLLPISRQSWKNFDFAIKEKPRDGIEEVVARWPPA
jgi:hypothetical protein